MYYIFIRCISKWKKSSIQNLWMILDNITSILFALIPFIVILVVTILILSFLKKNSTLQKQKIALVLSVSILHLVSCVPYLLYTVLMNVLKPSAEVKYRNSTVAQLYAGANYVNYLTTMCNPVLYYFTSASFGAYIRRCSRNWMGRISRVGDVEMQNTGITSVGERFSNIHRA